MKFIAFVVALLLSGNAFASDENFYTRFDTAYSIGVEDGVKDGFSWQTGFGWKWFDALRTEMTFDYMRNDLGDSLRGEALHGRISSKAVFVNAAWDVFSVRGITPYVMAGNGCRSQKTPHRIPVANRGRNRIFVAEAIDFGYRLRLYKPRSIRLG